VSIAVSWTVDHELQVAFSDCAAFELAVVRDGAVWSWRVYLAFDDCDDDEIVAAGSAGTPDDAMAQATRALVGVMNGADSGAEERGASAADATRIPEPVA
jgi:hypothetical protein